MLLSINRVLQLLKEGKNIDDIARLAECQTSEVVAILNKFKDLINLHDRGQAKKKIILKKKEPFLPNPGEVLEKQLPEKDFKEIFKGAELFTIPVGSFLSMDLAGEVEKKFNFSGIGIVIYNKEGNQIGKISSYVGKSLKLTNDYVKYLALIRAIKFALYFQTKKLKIRLNSELIVQHLNDKLKNVSNNLKNLFDQVKDLEKQIDDCSFEYLEPHMNDKAIFLAKNSFASKLGK